MTAKILTTTFGLDFIQRTLRTTGIVLIVIFGFGAVYFDFYDGLAVLSAGVWSMVNLIFLSALIRTVVRPDGIDKLSAFGLALLKFPLLYAAGYFLITADIFRPAPLVMGLSMVLVVMVLKAVSRAVLKLDVASREDSRGLA